MEGILGGLLNKLGTQSGEMWMFSPFLSFMVKNLPVSVFYLPSNGAKAWAAEIITMCFCVFYIVRLCKTVEIAKRWTSVIHYKSGQFKGEHNEKLADRI